MSWIRGEALNLPIPTQESRGTTVSVVIAGRNRKEKLRRCLLALQRSSIKPREIIYVDTGSEDDTPACIASEFPEVTVVWQRGGNPQLGRNTGASVSTGEWVMFLDDDFVVDQETIASLLATASLSARIGVIGCRTVNQFIKDGEGLRDFGTISPLWLPRFAKGTPGGGVVEVFVIRGTAFVKRQALEQVGGWDETFFIEADEVDFLCRIHMAGWLVACDLNTFVTDLNEERGSPAPVFVPEMSCTRLELGRRNMLIVFLKDFSHLGVLFSLPSVFSWMFIDSIRTRTLGSFRRSVSMVLAQFASIRTWRAKGYGRTGGGFLIELRLYLRLQTAHALPF